MNTPTGRILDASLNRAAEGLRGVDDYARFVLNDPHLTRLLKELRHELGDAGNLLPGRERHAARDTSGDVGTAISVASENERTDAWDVCMTSCERVKQSLRSLEEYSKTFDGALATRFEQLRYRFYTLEAALGRTVDAAQRLAEVRLCVLVDGDESLAAFQRLAGQLCDADVGMIQLRDKQLRGRELLERGRALCELVKNGKQAVKPLVIVNDRADVAAAVDADGVHLGQDDLCVKAARAILGPRKLIGVSTHSIQQARQAVLDGANYLGAGPVFPSSTKSFDVFPGLDFLREASAEIRLPTFAIGGIALKNVAELQARNVTRVAVSGAIRDAAEPGELVRAFHEELTVPPYAP